MHGQWNSSTGHRVAEGRPAAVGAEGRRGPPEKVDSKSEELDARAQRQIHLQGLQSSRRNQCHVQSWGHTWVSHRAERIHHTKYVHLEILTIPDEVKQIHLNDYWCLRKYISWSFGHRRRRWKQSTSTQCECNHCNSGSDLWDEL